jgi:hypothetical protein
MDQEKTVCGNRSGVVVVGGIITDCYLWIFFGAKSRWSIIPSSFMEESATDRACLNFDLDLRRTIIFGPPFWLRPLIIVNWIRNRRKSRFYLHANWSQLAHGKNIITRPVINKLHHPQKAPASSSMHVPENKRKTSTNLIMWVFRADPSLMRPIKTRS